VFEQGFFIWGQWLSYLELAAMISGVLGVWLTMKQNVLCFPVGMINVGLYAFLFFTPGIRLYADALLQCIYFFLLIYGWYKWSGGNTHKELAIPSSMSKPEWKNVILIAIPSALVLGTFLQAFTNADLAWADSSLTVLSLIAQWMIAKKKIENWMLWILADICYIPLYIYKDLPLTAFLYFLFLMLAIKGLKEWKQSILQSKHA